MSNGFTPVCEWLPAGDGIAVICAVLAALLFVGIALGFGPLRAWLGMDVARGGPRGCFVSEEGSILSAWRLYRQLGSTNPPSTHFSAPDVPALIVPHSIGRSAWDAPSSGSGRYVARGSMSRDQGGQLSPGC